MKKKYRNYIEEHSLFPAQHKVLLTVSGGVDSMVMLHLTHACGFSFAVAHCNFHLRDAESDADEQLVRKACKTLGVDLYVQHFKTTDYAKEKNVSIQVAARELRYHWFSQLCSEKGFYSVATAHNKNDVAETILLNLTRGAGLKGLTGIKPKTQGLVRPLLFAFRSEIENYANTQRIAYRNDSSNAQIKYARNRIRHRVLPELEKINEGVVDNIYSTSLFLGETWLAIDAMNQEFKEKASSNVETEVHYSIDKLLGYPFRQVFLVEELIAFGFSPALVFDIEKSLSTQPGKAFYSQNFQMVRDRESLIISPIKKETGIVEQKIDEGNTQIQHPIAMQFEVITPDASFEIPKSSAVATLDYSELKFPLTLRLWRKGDWFIPFGMRGHKKVSDFLIDQKVPLHRKDSIYVLESNGDIVWVVGYRTDNRYRVNEGCNKIFMVRLG